MPPPVSNTDAVYFNVIAIQKNLKTIEIQQLFPVPKGQINKLKEEIWSPLGTDRFLMCLEVPNQNILNKWFQLGKLSKRSQVLVF